LWVNKIKGLTVEYVVNSCYHGPPASLAS
jgi:hypothetical protein